MVNEFQTAIDEFKRGYALMQEAKRRMNAVFLPTYDSFNFLSDKFIEAYGYEDGEDRVLKEVTKDVWKALVERMGIRPVMSMKAAKEMDDQIESGKMPPITEANILATMEGIWNRIPEFIEAAVVEVFDWLRPKGWGLTKYKTNHKNEWELTDTIIVPWSVEAKWSGVGFRVMSNSEQNLRCLDNVFRMLDGKGPIKSYNGELSDAIGREPTGKGETDYFRFSAYKNRNLHLKVKRADLLAKLNAVAGGMRLKDFKSNVQPDHSHVKPTQTGDKVKDLQFYQTPDALACQLVLMAEIEPGHHVLEPSAGMGAIVRAIIRTSDAGKPSIAAVEIDPDKIKYLQELLGPDAVACCDFLQLDKAAAFDRIVANPPFCGGQDIAHLKKMYDCLTIGGRLVCVTAPSWLTKSDNTSREFRYWLTDSEEPIGLVPFSEDGAEASFRRPWKRTSIEKLPSGSFKESGTMVEALVVTIDKTNDDWS